MPEVVAIGGKTSRRCHKAGGRGPLHPVSAWAARRRLVLGQEATDAESDEITAIPPLLERLESAGALVTMMPWARRPPSRTRSCGGAGTTCSR